MKSMACRDSSEVIPAAGGSQAGIQPTADLLRHRIRGMTASPKVSVHWQDKDFSSAQSSHSTLVTLARYFSTVLST